MFTQALLHKIVRPSPQLGRGFSSVKDERNRLLRQIYAPFAGLDKNDPKYQSLGASGKVWENYFQPGNSERYGYLRLQKLHAPILKEIDTLKASNPPSLTVLKSLVAAYAHQSVMIEANTLHLADSIRMTDHLTTSFFQDINLGTLSAADLAATPFPDLRPLLPDADPSQVAELRNHIIASHWVTLTAPTKPTPDLTESELRSLSAVVNKGTRSEDLYRLSWGRKVRLGDYRGISISVRSNPLTIFPYADEVPALMGRFIRWRDEERGLHPLILACQAVLYFVCVHPFLDGNGRVSRLLMQDFLVRRGYLPVVMGGLEGREEYLRLIVGAQRGEAGAWVGRVLEAELEALQTRKG